MPRAAAENAMTPTDPPDQRATNPGFRSARRGGADRVLLRVALLVALLAIAYTVYLVRGHL